MDWVVLKSENKYTLHTFASKLSSRRMFDDLMSLWMIRGSPANAEGNKNMMDDRIMINDDSFRMSNAPIPNVILQRKIE